MPPLGWSLPAFTRRLLACWLRLLVWPLRAETVQWVWTFAWSGERRLFCCSSMSSMRMGTLACWFAGWLVGLPTGALAFWIAGWLAGGLLEASWGSYLCEAYVHVHVDRNIDFTVHINSLTNVLLQTNIQATDSKRKIPYVHLIFCFGGRSYSDFCFCDGVQF